MNVKAFGIAAVMPAEGKTDAVVEALQSFIDTQKMNFEFYLADQYEVAENAKLETLTDGTVLMVMCEDQDAVYDNIVKAIQG
jgi:putative heme iron utilization protein